MSFPYIEYYPKLGNARAVQVQINPRRIGLRYPGPCLVEARVDPHTPPMPPRVTAEEVVHFAEALARGTPHAAKIALTVASDKVRGLV